MNKTLISIGEALIDFIPSTIPASTPASSEASEYYSPAVGGAPANVCAAYSILGGKSRMITQLGDDLFGHKIIDVLTSVGTDCSCISLSKKANTALAFVKLHDDGNREFSFYRKPSADMLLLPEQLRAEFFEDCYALHFCSVSLGDFPMKDAHDKAISLARENGGLISFDPNLRFQLWNDTDSLHKVVLDFLPKADIIKISEEELDFICGTPDIEAALPSLLTGNTKLVIFTQGSKGAWAFTNNAKAFSPSADTRATDTTGAGDGFIGSFLFKLSTLGISSKSLLSLDSQTLKECLDFSNKFCGISVTRSGAIPSYPNQEEMNEN